MSKKSAAQVAVAEAIALRLYPSSLKYPEMGQGTLLSEWFGCPTLTWVPESMDPGRKPKCVLEGCSCQPKVKAYKQRTVEDVEHRTILFYARYQCNGAVKKSFSTISDAYLTTSKMLLLNFPYLLTHKTGFSSGMFDIVYGGMLSTKGIAGAVANIVRRRRKRYYRNRSRVGVRVEELRIHDTKYLPLLPPTEEQYMSNHACLDTEVLKELWLAHTNILSRLCAAQMTDTKCERVFRMDHSQKFCSKLKVFGADYSKEQSTELRLLLLVQYEVGQIMGRALTKSENHAETETLLRSMESKMNSESNGPRICVCDNANANRNLIERVFGNAVIVRQDLFHVITRFTEKVNDNAKKRWLSTQVSVAMYDVQRNLRPPEECESRVKLVLESVDPASISVKRSDWDGCAESNLAQIRRGDVYVEENQYTDAGGEVRINSTI